MSGYSGNLRGIVQQRFQEWVDRRTPIKPKVTLNQNNIYIIPTVEGMAFLLLLLVLLLTAINYQNSLIYLLTFFLGALFVLSILLCFNNLKGLSFSAKGGAMVQSGEDAAFLLSVRAQRDHSDIAAGLVDSESQTLLPLRANAQSCTLLLKTNQRGRKKLDRVRVETRYPFGLIVAWTWLRLDASVLVYPNPVEPVEPLYSGRDGDETGKHSSTVPGHEEFSGLKNYVQGEPLNRISWKHYASKEVMVSKEFAAQSADTRWLDFNDYDGADTELRLSYLCFEAQRRASGGLPFGLKLPGNQVELGVGRHHLETCLEALALYGEGNH